MIHGNAHEAGLVATRALEHGRRDLVGWHNGTAVGEIKDSAGAPVIGAKVVATLVARGIKTTAITDKKGSYSFPTLTPGAYYLDVEAKGFKSSTKNPLSVHVDSAAKLDIVLDSSDTATK